jgi:hypothetical protein
MEVMDMRSFLIASTLVAGLVFSACARDITTLDGKTYKNVQISNVTPAGFDIAYTPKGGGLAIKEMFFKNLPEKIRKEFGYTPKRAQAFEEKVNRIRQERQKKEEWQYKQKLKKEKKEEAENDHLMSQIQAGRLFVYFKSLKTAGNGSVGWGSLTDASVTTGQLGKIYLVGLQLPNGAEWSGYIYPLDTNIDGYTAYASNMPQALEIVKKNIASGVYKRQGNKDKK